MGGQVRSGNCVQVVLLLWRNNPEQGLSLIHRRERCTSRHSWLHACARVDDASRPTWRPLTSRYPIPALQLDEPARLITKRGCRTRVSRRIAKLSTTRKRLRERETSEGNSGSDKSSLATYSLQGRTPLRETNIITVIFPPLCLSLKQDTQSFRRQSCGTRWDRRDRIHYSENNGKNEQSILLSLPKVF